MPIVPITTVPQKGMITDLHPQYFAEGTYTYALNAQVEQTGEDGYLLQNTSSNFLSIKFPEGYSVIGFKHILEQDRIIWFLTNGTTSQIGETIYHLADYDNRPLIAISNSPCAGCKDQNINVPKPLEKTNQILVLSYFPIVSSDCLNFNIYRPVDVEYKITDCTLQVYFVDGYNPDRYLYFDYDPIHPHNSLKLQDKFTTNDNLNCESTLFQPSIKRPRIKLDEVFSGGKLKKGVYQFIAGYSTSTGEALSGYYGITQPIPIFSPKQEQETDQAIRIEVDNLSDNLVYKYYNVVVGETINSVTEYKLVGTYPITQNKVTYDGNDQLPRIDINEILQKYPYYKASKSITKSNEYLFRAGLSEFPILNLQRICNKIKLQWQTIAFKEGSYKDPEIASKYRTYQRDEVYPFGIVFELAEGGDTPVYHIPGRAATLADKRALSVQEQKDAPFNPSDSCYKNKTLQYWQTYNTANKIGTSLQAANCEFTPHEYGDMAYWESEERYPDDKNIWGELAGQPIRHPKFPDYLISYIHDVFPGYTTFPLQAFDYQNTIYPIGIKIDHNQISELLQEAVDTGLIKQEDKDRIKGYRIVRGNRANNKSIVAKGQLFNMWEYTKQDTKYYYPNYPYNDLNPDPFIAKNDHVKNGGLPQATPWTDNGRYTFHSPDTSFTQPTPGTILKIEVEQMGYSKGHYKKVDDIAHHKLLSDEAYTMARWFGSLIGAGTKINNDTESELNNLGSNLGSTLGTAVGGPIGGIVGSIAGSMLGGLLPNSITTNGATKIAEGITRMSLAIHNMDKILQLLSSLSSFHNYFVQYNSVGKYSNFFTRVNGGHKQRIITNSAYLKPELTSISEDDTSVFINNYNRESSVYLKVNELINQALFLDSSRHTIKEKYLCNDWEGKDAISYISTLYASIKNYRPTQYGSINSVEYLETSGESFSVDEPGQSFVFGGDSYIGRFSYKRKMPYFIAAPFKLPDGTDFSLSDFANVGYPTYYFNTQGSDETKTNAATQFFRPLFNFNNPTQVETIRGAVGNLDFAGLGGFIGFGRVPKSNLDCTEDNGLDKQWIVKKGIVYLHSYGIPSFLVETDINLDYRYSTNTKEGDFYPRQSNIDEWLEEKNVSIREDNTYNYDRTYSKQIKESPLFGLTPEQLLGDCQTHHDSRVIYSGQSEIIDQSVDRDSWLIHKANDKHDFSKVNGKLISVEGIENDKVLVRFENTFQVFNSYSTLQTDTSTIQLGTGGMFATKPQEWVKADLGYGGTQHRDIIHTEFGHVMIDSKRGQVFLMSGNDLDEISKEGMKNWFSDNLPFQISKSIPNLPTEILDNSFLGIGLSSYYDRIKKVLYITKLDYKPKRKSINFDFVNGFYIIEDGQTNRLSLSDTNYFENISWTISYNFYTKTWVSFHSFLPNFAISSIDHFLTGNNTTGTVWAHNVSDKSYQVYYGKKYPFIVEAHLNAKSISNINAIEYAADVLLRDEYSTIRVSTLPFNEMYVSTDATGSGRLLGVIANPNDMSQSFSYPKKELDHHKILVSNKDLVWRFNQFSNLYQSNHAMWTQKGMIKAANPVFSYNRNTLNYSPIKGNWIRVTLINNLNTNYSILLKWVMGKLTPSIN